MKKLLTVSLIIISHSAVSEQYRCVDVFTAVQVKALINPTGANSEQTALAHKIFNGGNYILDRKSTRLNSSH